MNGKLSNLQIVGFWNLNSTIRKSVNQEIEGYV
jgi:hypothetical protein